VGSIEPAGPVFAADTGASGAADRATASEPQLGPARIAGILEMPASTVHRVLVRQGLNRAAVDRSSHWAGHPPNRDVTARRARARRYKRLSRIPRGRGWRAHSWSTRHTTRKQRVGNDNVHSMIDAYSRTAYSEAEPQQAALDVLLGVTGRTQRRQADLPTTIPADCSGLPVAMGSKLVRATPTETT
jgi:hypothetical protein